MSTPLPLFPFVPVCERSELSPFGVRAHEAALSAAKALHAFYRYGALHGYVRLRWRFVDDILGADFIAPGETQLYHVLKHAVEPGLPVDIVTGTAPGWAEPWSRARRMHVLQIGPGVVKVREQGVIHVISQQEIQAIRI